MENKICLKKKMVAGNGTGLSECAELVQADIKKSNNRCKGGDGIFYSHRITGSCHCCIDERALINVRYDLAYDMYDSKHFMGAEDCVSNQVLYS